MATAEHLLNEARYAFHSISFGKSRQNRRNAARAKSLCRKIIRKYPTSVQAGRADAILRQLEERAASPGSNARHQQFFVQAHHRTATPTAGPRATTPSHGTQESLNWGELVGWIISLPKAVLAVMVLLGLILFGLFGPLLFLLLLPFVLLIGPFRHRLKPEQQKAVNAFVVQANALFSRRTGRQ